MITLQTLYKRQIVLDKVVKHLIQQGRPSKGDSRWVVNRDMFKECPMYRGEDGTSCAIGCLIPDESYRVDWEGDGIYDPSVDGTEFYCQKFWKAKTDQILEAIGMVGEYKFCRDLQGLHDDGFTFYGDSFRSMVLKRSIQFAERWGLGTRTIKEYGQS